MSITGDTNWNTQSSKRSKGETMRMMTFYVLVQTTVSSVQDSKEGSEELVPENLPAVEPSTPKRFQENRHGCRMSEKLPQPD